MQCLTVCHSQWQSVTDCVSMLQFVAVYNSLCHYVVDCGSVRKFVSVCANLRQSLEVCCSLGKFIVDSGKLYCSLWRSMAVCGTLLLVFCILGQNVTRSITSPKLLTLSRAAPSAVSKVRGGDRSGPPRFRRVLGGFGFNLLLEPHILPRMTPDKRIYNFQIPRTTQTDGLKKWLFQEVYQVRKGPPLWKWSQIDQLLFFLGKRCNFIEWKVLSPLSH